VLENAIKYTDEGVVALTASAEDGCVRAAIADTGPGIADDDLPHVFERFYRGDPSRAAGGTGLGLSIARQIATAHGGHIELTSESGSGTTVTVTLPAAI
jgi:signal transduction histidine kinase